MIGKTIKLIILLIVVVTVQSMASARQTNFPKYDGSYIGNPNTKQKQQTRELYSSARNGFKLVRSGKSEAGVIVLREVLEQDDTIDIAYIGLAEAYNALGDLQKSVLYYRKIMYSNPNTNWMSSLTNEYEHLARFASVLQNMGKTSEAQKIYRRVLDAAPERMKTYLYKPDEIHLFDNKKMVSSIHLAMADIDKEAAHTGSKAEVEGFLKQCLSEARAATAIAPNYAPAHLMLGKMFVEQSEWDTLQKRPDKVKLAKAQAVQAYKRAASLGNGETKAMAQTALKSYWLAGVTATP